MALVKVLCIILCETYESNLFLQLKMSFKNFLQIFSTFWLVFLQRKLERCATYTMG